MQDRWQDADKFQVHSKLFAYVSTVESAQSATFERFLRYAALYDPTSQMGMAGGGWWQAGQFSAAGFDAQVSENVCASNVDTVAAIISRSQPRVRFMTDDGDWSTQRTARHLEWYTEGLSKLLELAPKAQRVFKDAAVFGTGLLKIYEEEYKGICVERVLVDEIVVDESDCRTSLPTQMHQRKLVNKDVLKARFSQFESEIDKAGTDGGFGRFWADYRPIDRDQVVVLESWQLMLGDRPGRHCICVEGCTLLDEEWAYDYFPFARIAWNEPSSGWYGIGLVARIAGHQRALNKLNWQIDRQLDQHAVPTTWVQMADANMTVQATNRLGTFGVYKGSSPPTTIIPPAVSGEQFKRLQDVKASSYEESGVSRLAAASMKPAGIESAVAMREYKDTTTERFAMQEQAYERLILDATWLILGCAKRLGDDAPEIVRRSRAGSKKIRWADVDLGEARVQMAAASSLSRTPAGRTQTVIEWASAGVITQDEARRLLQHPDLERAMSLYTAALEDIERCIEDVLDGAFLVPEPYQNLKLGVWRFQQAYLKARGDSAPDDILENMRTWTVQAAQILNPPAPEIPVGGPPVEAPVSAFAPQAMELRPRGMPA